MGENRSSSSRLSLRNNAAAAVGGGGGEIVEVQGGGHIMRSTGRKDRHSKVCTAKGPRDRRVRLAAHTAIQFYDVQDRLGYDRPSKAVDWLIKKAKPAIDELAELPAWKPNTGSTPTQEKPPQQDNLAGPSSKIENEASFLPPSLDSDSIADTIKSFFPMGASEEANNSNLQFQSFTQQPDLLSRTGSHSQDLRLSLQSFQDPSILLHHQNQQNPNPVSHRAILTGFDASAWPEQNQQRYDTTTGGYMFNSPHQQQQQQQPLFQQLFGGQNQFFSSQRGPLQSSYSPSIRAWMDPSSSSAIAIASLDPNQHQHQHYQSAMLPIYNYPSSLSGVGEFSGFRIPARIQGEEEEEHDGISDKPSSASSDSRR